MNRFIPRILSIQTAKFSSNIYLIPHILRIRVDSFRVFSVYEQIHSTYSQYTNRFIPRTLSIRTDSFRVIRECAQIIRIFRIELFSLQLLKGYYFKKSMYVCNWTENLQGIIDYLALAWQKISFRVFRLNMEWPSNSNILANSNLYSKII